LTKLNPPRITTEPMTHFRDQFVTCPPSKILGGQSENPVGILNLHC